jgi:hypothetical protein
MVDQVLSSHRRGVSRCWGIRSHYHQSTAAAPVTAWPSCYSACMTADRSGDGQLASQTIWPLQALQAPHTAGVPADLMTLLWAASVASVTGPYQRR